MMRSSLRDIAGGHATHVSWTAAIIVLLLSGHAAAQFMGAGGLVIDMRVRGRQPQILGIDLQRVTRQASESADYLHVRLAGVARPRSIRLPAGSLSSILRAENSYNQDELIISADNYLFGTSADGPYRITGMELSKTADRAKELVTEYAREVGISPQFALGLLGYDAYADAIVCGASPTIGASHPLAAEKHPSKEIVRVLGASRHGGPFRQLFSLLSVPPVCVSQLSLFNEISKDGTSQIMVRTKRWFIGSRWDQEMIVLNDTQQSIADLPYSKLAGDIEARWDEYRKSFPGLDELSSIVEAMTILRMFRFQHVVQYQKLQRALANEPELHWDSRHPLPQLHKRPCLNIDQWHRKVLELLGDYIETDADAEMALSLRMYRWNAIASHESTGGQFSYPPSWDAGIDRLARSSHRLIAAKIMLVRALEAEPSQSFPLFAAFFERARSLRPESLGLWLQSLRWLQIYCNQVHRLTDGHQSLLRAQRAEALAEVDERAQYIITGKSREVGAATQFLAIAVGAHLFDLAATEWATRDEHGDRDSPQLTQHVERMAEIHRLSVRELEVDDPDEVLLLAHYRYLGYLAEQVPQARARVAEIRDEISRQRDELH